MPGEICPSQGDMNDCKKKPRCKWGNCEGQSLPSGGGSCPDGYTFREDYCDCQPVDCGPVCDLNLVYKITYGSYTGANCSPTTVTCSGLGGNYLTQRIENVVQDSAFSFIGIQDPSGPVGTCSGTNPETAYVRVVKCSDGIPSIEDVLLNNGGCSINTSAGRTLIGIEDGGSYFDNCKVNISVTSQRYNNVYDCFDCTGVRVSQSLSDPYTSVRSTTVADYETAYLDCSNLASDCESSCLWRTSGGKLWHDAGWDSVINCNAAGVPDSGQNFICPDNVMQPCNRWQQDFGRYYSGRGTLYQRAKLV